MGRHEDRDEGYYEDEGEFVEDERLGLSQRVAAVFGTSYGISILVHGALLMILMTIVIAAPHEEEIQTLVIKAPAEKPKFDQEAIRDVEKNIEIPLPEPVDVPVVDLLDEPVPPEPPKGDPTHSSNKKLDSHAFTDVIAVGPGRAAGRYGRHDGIGRVGEFGGGPKTEDAVIAALRWLAAHQSPDGRWDADDWAANCSRGPRCAGPGHNRGGPNTDVGVTSLALLAFMGHGNSVRFGDFKRTVRKGMRWLARQQRADGSVGFVEAGAHGGAYCHAMATMALAEGYGISRVPRYRKPAQQATDFIVSAQNPGLAWRYGVRDGKNDTSVTGWVVLALKASKVAGLDVPSKTFEGALNWLNRATASSGDVGYVSPGGGSSLMPENDGKFDEVPTMTAVSVVCRIFAGDLKSNETLRRGVRLLAERPPAWERRKLNFYYWYYGTYAVFHFDDSKWKPWNEAMKKALLPNQRMGACEDGSWDPVGEWCLGGGRVYATAINALTLQIYYRYRRQNLQARADLPAKPK